MKGDSDDRLDEGALAEGWLVMARESYNAPGEPPREEIWREVEARLFQAPEVSRWRATTPWIPLLAAAALVLVLGVGLGRWSAAGSNAAGADVTGSDLAGAPGIASSPGSSAAGDPPRANASVRFATARHLTDAEALLDFVSADARQGRVDRDVVVWGRGLLTQTRLLLDSEVADEPAVREVLEDLELVLAQITLLGAPSYDQDRLTSELNMIAEGLNEGGVRTRIRSVLPSVAPQLSAADDD